MKKIKSSLMLTSLLLSLGIQPSIALASAIEQPSKAISEVIEPTEAETGESTDESLHSEPAEEPKQPSVEPTVEPTAPTEDSQQKSDEELTQPTEEEKTPTDDSKEVPAEERTQPIEKSVIPTEEPVEATYSTSTYTSSIGSSVHFEANTSTQEFIKTIGESARQIGLENDLYASVMIAQAILESGSGQSDLASEPNFNLFGIKGDYQGNSVSYITNEDDGAGHLYSVESSFRKYPSYKESLQDYADLMANGISGNNDFYNGVHKSEAGTYKKATQYLTGTYATDIYYQDKLNGLIETYHLTEYDKEKAVETTTNNKQPGTSFDIKNPITQQRSTFIMPLESDYVVSSPFENRDNPITGEREQHNGIDLAVSKGTPIHASNDGIVVQSGYESGAGNYVLIQHDNGLITHYYHMSQIATQTEAVVKAGDVIGYVGSTGNSTGSHLHFGLSTGVWSGYLNPADYMNF